MRRRYRSSIRRQPRGAPFRAPDARTPRRSTIEPTHPAWRRRDWLALGGVTLLAAGLRLPSLARPTGLVFDEIFYAQDACWYVAGTEAVCGITELVSRAHPPLGKWLIGGGIAAFGYSPFGWRVAAAVAGILTVILVFLLGRRLFAPRVGPGAALVGATAAAGLLATDFLHVVHSRVAMLDAFITLFVVLAVLAVVLDRDRRREPPPDAPPSWLERLTLGRPWRLLAGASLGAAAATKWSGAYVGLAIVGLVVAWEIADERRRSGRPLWPSTRAAFRREAPPSVVLLGVVPLLVYLASYTGRMPGELIGPPWEAGTVWRGIWDHGRAMLDFHTGLSGHHPYESPPWSWPFLRRPVAYFFAEDGGAYREILALGNPAVWWPGLAALVGAGALWVRRGASAWAPELVILAAALATYLPWLVLSGSRSQVFLWYLLPTIPFLVLALGLVAALAWRRLAGRLALGAYGALVAGTLAFYLPLLVALPVEPDDWRTRILFRDCRLPSGEVQELPDDTTSEGRPPEGWCWI